MSNIIDSIKLSGTVYTLSAQTSGGGGNPTVELTQAEYDALVSAGTVSADTYYIITDAQAGDLTQYWTSAQTQSAITEAVSGKVDTSAITTSITSGSTDSEIPTAKAVYDAIPTGGTGGGKAISAGTNISVTTGETADTVSCTLPITAGTNSSGKGIIVGDSECSATGMYGIAIGHNSDANGMYSLCNGSNSDANSQMSFAWGDNCKANGERSWAVGYNVTTSNKYDQFLHGRNISSSNELETAFGLYNITSSSSSTFGNSGNTLFSIGNGYDFSSTHNRHNAIEIRQNGDIYIPNTNDTSITGDLAYSLYPMIKLQDYLGGGSVTIDPTLDSGSTNPVANSAITTALDAKQDTLVSGTNIKTINNESIL